MFSSLISNCEFFCLEHRKAVTVSFVHNTKRTCYSLGLRPANSWGGAMHGGGGVTLCLHHCPSRGQGCRRTPGGHCHTGEGCVTLQMTDGREERDRHILSKPHVYWIQNRRSRKENQRTQRRTFYPWMETTHQSLHISLWFPGWRFHLKNMTHV